MKFIDEATVFLKAGSGGNGCVSFRREKYVPMGGPDGGMGGHGGSIVFQASSDRHSLLDLKIQKTIEARAGAHGRGKGMSGRSAEDVIVLVPVGSVIKAEDGSFMADLAYPGERVVAARGGRGGRGNESFKSSTNQSPRYAEPGEPGEERLCHLELKLLADIGLIGLPNAGKSTLLSVLTAARPKIAEYPFTSLVPTLGVFYTDDDRSVVIADLPGLIAGAHAGVGLGFQFLRHIERTRVLLHLVSIEHESLRSAYDVVRRELTQYPFGLVDRPELVVVTKADLCDADEAALKVSRFSAEINKPVLLISAATHFGIETLSRELSILSRPTLLSPDLLPNVVQLNSLS